MPESREFMRHSGLPTKVIGDPTAKQFWVPYLVDTGAPTTYLMKDYFKLLGVAGKTMIGVYIAGIKLDAELSSGKIENVNILGADFMAHGTLFVATKIQGCCLAKGVFRKPSAALTSNHYDNSSIVKAVQDTQSNDIWMFVTYAQSQW
eukprot:TRINITY_DN9759_c0_g5_i1.p5 TRINITY_DN9759_c0_g5~~TRINITY_DN9759_c0_g5_i1.p5  ORF type:complete len:148 (-),score=0.87 TRINITY_DN9759_c0_g5_i1:190-633(-)